MKNSSAPLPLRAASGGPLKGTAIVPGDKSISHRALILGAMTVGQTDITNLLEASDVLNTAAAMQSLGARISCSGKGQWRVEGVGVGGFYQPGQPLDFGNSGTGCRLTMGAVATTPISVEFTGDASLRQRPMGRVLEPLQQFRLSWEGHGEDGGFLPVSLKGANYSPPVRYILEVPSAQVKSALLLAALNVPGTSTIIEPTATRDHTERMLNAFGAKITIEEAAGGRAISITGETDLRPVPIFVPCDPSSAAFPLVAALIVPSSEVLLEKIMLNPLRTGLLKTLQEMGADIQFENRQEVNGEMVSDLRVRHSALKGVEVPPARAPSMIDEFPILSVAAAFAEGPTIMRGLEELRVKESDRLSAIAAGLKESGVRVEETTDGLKIEGRGAEGVAGGGRVVSHMDHRIAMSFLMLGLASRDAVAVDDGTMISTSFPDFEDLMSGLGAQITRANA
jgi:3-phosphoshikimate 1-carboxyvinyltransferase